MDTQDIMHVTAICFFAWMSVRGIHHAHGLGGGQKIEWIGHEVASNPGPTL